MSVGVLYRWCRSTCSFHLLARTNSATVHTVRYLRPRLFPLYGFAVPVKTQLRFHADGSNAGKDASQGKMYVTSLEEQWLMERILSPFPVVSWLYTALMTPVLTLLLLALSNVLFGFNARVSSSKRQYIDTSVDALGSRARKSLPKEVASNVNSGYQRGEKLAQGWGTTVVDVVNKTFYPILSTLEVLTQRGASAVPLSLPYPFIYDAHSRPQSGKERRGEKKIAASKSSSESKPAPKSSASAQGQQGEDIKKATVDVAPSLDGSDQGKTVEIASRVNTETKDEPAPAKESQADTSLYAQLKRDGELPGPLEEAKLSVPAASGQTGASSEEDDPLSHGGSATNGAPKKKKSSGSKKKKGGVSHVHPPSFKEGLHQAEEHDAAQAQH